MFFTWCYFGQYRFKTVTSYVNLWYDLYVLLQFRNYFFAPDFYACAGKGLPNIVSSLKHFKDAFDWVEANNSGRIMPHEGADVEYDNSCKKIKEIESSLTKHLKEQRKLLGDTSVRVCLW